LYDAAGNLTMAANAAGSTRMSYDALNRVKVTQEPFSQRLTFCYDAVSNQTEVRDSQNGGIATSLAPTSVGSLFMNQARLGS
jgi:YD repeat-containing protein